MNSIIRLSTLFLGVAGIISSVTGCGDTVTDPWGDTLVKPGAGSEYIYKHLHYSAGYPGVLQRTTMDTFSILRTDLTVQGLGGLRVVRISNQPDDTLYLQYERNGDMTLYRVDGGTSATGTLFPLNFPFASRARLQTGSDTITSAGPTIMITTDSVYYDGSVNLSLPAGTMEVAKVVSVTDRRRYNGQMMLVSGTRDAWTTYFSPRIGFIARRTRDYEYLDATGRITERVPIDDLSLASYTIN